MKKHPNHYLKLVEWSEEDGCYVGTCPALFLGGVHGSNEAKVYADLCTAVDEVIALKQQHGDPLPAGFASRSFSGKFLLRVPPALHQLLATRALQRQESLNQYCAAALTQLAASERSTSRPRPTRQTARKGRPASRPAN